MSKYKRLIPSLPRTLSLFPRPCALHFIFLLCWQETRTSAPWSFVPGNWYKAPKPMLSTNETFQTGVCWKKRPRSVQWFWRQDAFQQGPSSPSVDCGSGAGRLNLVPSASCCGTHWEGRSPIMRIWVPGMHMFTQHSFAGTRKLLLSFYWVGEGGARCRAVFL